MKAISDIIFLQFRLVPQMSQNYLGKFVLYTQVLLKLNTFTQLHLHRYGKSDMFYSANTLIKLNKF